MQYLIVGAKFRPPARALLDTLALGTRLIARRESTNQYDPNAVAVLLPKGFETNNAMKIACEGFGFSIEELQAAPYWHLGYIPREFAVTLGPAMDEAQKPEIEGTLGFNAQGFAQFRMNDGAFNDGAFHEDN